MRRGDSGQVGIRRRAVEIGEIIRELVVAVDDPHLAATENERRSDHDGEADPVDHLAGVERRMGGPVGRQLDPEPAAKRRELLAVLGHLDRCRRSAGDRHSGRLQFPGQVQRGLPAQLHDDGDSGLLGVYHGQHVLDRQRLEIEPIGGVVVGRHRLRIAVDHHGFVAGVSQGEGGVDAAVVEFDALPDPVGSRPEHHHPGLVRGRRHLVLVFEGAVHVGGVGLELGCTGVDGLEGGADACRQRRLSEPRSSLRSQR